jgi:hypothetical protein
MASRELDELLGVWRSEPLPAASSALDERAGSAAVAAALRRVAEGRRLRARFRKAATVLAFAAAVAGLGVGAWLELGRESFVAHAGPSVVVGSREGDVSITDDVGQVLETAAALREGYGVRTERGSATLAFPSGASAKVASRSTLKLSRAREREALFLASGAVDVEVPKLDAARGFSVETPDALVTVHGTRFSVLVVSTPDGPRTRVQVTRGVVSVLKGGREVFLTAGQAWPREDAPAAAAEAAANDAPAVGAPAAATARGDAGPEVDLEEAFAEGDGEEPSLAAPDQHGPGAERESGRAPSRQRKAREFDRRELADQNQRFARAMVAKKNGDTATALRELGAILRRYPGSPLTQEVRVERLRILRSLGRSELAAHEARRYLRDFPHGYAVVEAEASLSEPP